MTSLDRRTKTALAIFLVALVSRFAAVSLLGSSLDVLQVSMRQFDMARNALEGRFLESSWEAMQSYGRAAQAAGKLIDYEPEATGEPTPEIYMDGGFALALASVWKVTGSRSPVAISWLQAVLDALASLLVLRAGTKLYSFRAGALAALAYALFLPLLGEVARPTYYVWPVFAAVVALAVLAEVPREGESSRREVVLFLAGGIALGLLHWVRSVVLLLSLAVGIGVALRTRSPRRSAIALACLLSVHAALVLPLAVRHHRLAGSWLPTQGNFAHMVWVGIGQYENPYGCENDDGAAMRFAVAKRPEAAGDYALEERTIREEVATILAKDPGIFLRNFLRRLARLTPFDPSTGLRSWPAPLDRPLVLLWPLALLYAARRRALVPALVPAAYFVFTVTPYYYLSTYVLPSIVVLLVPIAGLVADAEDPVFLPAERRGLSLAAWLLALVGPALSCALETSTLVFSLPPVNALGLVLEGAIGVALGLLSRNRKQAAAFALAAALARPSPWHLVVLALAVTAGLVARERTRPGTAPS